MDFLEAVFEEAQRQLFHGRFVQMKSGEFLVEGRWVWFVRKSAGEVVVSLDGAKHDIPYMG